MLPAASRRPRPAPRQVAAAPHVLVLLLLLSCCAGVCRGAPISPHGLWPEQELQLWNEIDAACSSFLSVGSQPQHFWIGHKKKFQGLISRFLWSDLCFHFRREKASSALEKLCFMITGTLPKPQKTDEKYNTKRFLFHYSKMRKLGNSNVSSVVHPLLQLVPQLQERRMKRLRVDEQFQGPIARPNRRYFLFRPRNGRRSEGYI